MKKKTASKPEAQAQFPLQDKDLPATQGMLQLVRRELKAEMKAGFRQVDARFAQIDSRFAQMDSKLELISSDIARIGVLVEEQNSKNRILLEALTGLWQRQDRVETRVDEVEKTVRPI